MSSIMRSRLFTPKFVFILLLIVLICLVGAYYIWQMYTRDDFSFSPFAQTPTGTTNSSGNSINNNVPNNNDLPNNVPTNSIFAIANYEGYWEDLVNGDSNLWIYDNKDGTIDFDYYKPRTDSKSATKVTINDKGVGEYTATDDSKGAIYLKENVVELEYVGMDGNKNNASFSKTSSKVISRRQLFEEIQKIIESNYKAINKDIFKYEESPNYLTLSLADGCFIKANEVNVSYEGIEFLRDDYIIDKKLGKLITLQDLLENDSKRIADVDNYIKGYLEIKKLEFERFCQLNNLSGEAWPYQEFNGVMDPYNYNSKYFSIDETNKNVIIKALSYPDEARKALGDLWIKVPFEVCFDAKRQREFGVISKKFNPEISKEIAMGYLKYIIQEQSGDNMENFGDSDTNSYNLIYFEKPELAIVDKNFNYKKYSYNDKMEIVESSDYNTEYTSIREKKYSPTEIKQVFCLSSKLYEQ